LKKAGNIPALLLLASECTDASQLQALIRHNA
jgi:hypothetical protein